MSNQKAMAADFEACQSMGYSSQKTRDMIERKYLIRGEWITPRFKLEKPDKDFCYLYVMHQPHCKSLKKIGIAWNIENREGQITRASGFRTKCIWAEKFVGRPRALSMEAELHRVFVDHRAQGEWFRHLSLSKISIMVEKIKSSGETSIEWVHAFKNPNSKKAQEYRSRYA